VRSLRIIVVDDNRDFAESIAEVLSEKGHEVELAFSGRDAVSLMVAEDRNPTAAEWSGLNAELDVLRRQLHSD